MTDPKICSMLDCGKPLGPDALEFTHMGLAAGGICENCLEGAPAIRVLFNREAKGAYRATEMVALEKTN